MANAQDILRYMKHKVQEDGQLDDDRLTCFLFPLGEDKTSFIISYKGLTEAEGVGTKKEIDGAIDDVCKRLNLPIPALN